MTRGRLPLDNPLSERIGQTRFTKEAFDKLRADAEKNTGGVITRWVRNLVERHYGLPITRPEYETKGVSND